MVIGHTDADGSASYNVALSERRALAIIDYFVGKGLSRDRIKIQFKGESEPIGDNKTVDGKQLNRRVDFLFI
jgi:outer membrane protein OmpA-like peptidoglycan-associated protein